MDKQAGASSRRLGGGVPMAGGSQLTAMAVSTTL